MSAEGINTNLTSLILRNSLDATTSHLYATLEHLATGLRVQHPKDDPGAFNEAVHLQSYINGLYSATRNSNDALSLTQLASSAVSEITTALHSARDLAIQAANGSNTTIDRQALQDSINQIKNQISDITTGTSYNNLNLLDGSLASINFQTGAMSNQGLVVSLPNVTTNALGSNNITSSNNKGLEQASYGAYMEANGSSVNVTAGLTNGIAGSSTIILTPVNSNGTTGAATTVTPVAGSTVAQLATAVNATGLAQASGYTAVQLTNFTIGNGNGNSITLGINTSNGVNVAGPTLTNAAIGGTTQQTYSNIATAINSNANMQNNDVYAIASASSLTIISPKGYDITATSGGTSTIGGIQILNNNGGAIGANTALAAGTSATAVGVLSVETAQNVNISFGDNQIFNSPTVVNAGVLAAQTNNLLAAQTLNIAGDLGSTTVALTANQSAAAVAAAVNNTTGLTGVSATATTSVALQNLSVSGTVSFNLTGGNNSTASISANVQTTDLTALVTAINNASGTTGISAQANGSNASIILSNSDGSNIQISNFNDSTAVSPATVSGATPVAGDGSSLSLPNSASINVIANPSTNQNPVTVTLYAGGARGTINSTVIGGEVNFASTSGFSVSSNIDGSVYSGSLFATAANANNTANFSSVANLDISTVNLAQKAISVIDQALNSLTQASANLGSISNAFDSKLRYLADYTANLEQAKGKLVGVDFANEAANSARLQMLASANIAMLAQANFMAKDYLKLLDH